MDPGLARVAQVAGKNSTNALNRAAQFSRSRIDDVRGAIQACPAFDPNLGWVVIGSLGRLEALDASDIDLVLLVPAGMDPSDARISGLDKEIRKAVETKLQIKVSKGENLTSPTSAAAIADPQRIGGGNDSVQLLTKRVLLLTESQAVINSELRQTIRKAIFAAYFESLETKGKHMLSLINDVVRYYRTVCVDYKHNVDVEGKPWAIRNTKLRHSRKFWFFSCMLAMIAAAVKYNGHSADEAEKDVQDLFDKSPAERLALVLDRAALLQQQPDVFSYYDKFLGIIGDPTVRAKLGTVVHANRHDSPDFRSLSENSDRLHRAMLELMAALPPNWNRHMLSHFLL